MESLMQAKILMLLLESESYCYELAQHMGKDKSSIHRSLKSLMGRGMIRVCGKNQARWYELTKEGRKEAEELREAFR